MSKLKILRFFVLCLLLFGIYSFTLSTKANPKKDISGISTQNTRLFYLRMTSVVLETLYQNEYTGIFTRGTAPVSYKVWETFPALSHTGNTKLKVVGGFIRNIHMFNKSGSIATSGWYDLEKTYLNGITHLSFIGKVNIIATGFSNKIENSDTLLTGDILMRIGHSELIISYLETGNSLKKTKNKQINIPIHISLIHPNKNQIGVFISGICEYEEIQLDEANYTIYTYFEATNADVTLYGHEGVEVYTEYE